VESLTHRRRQHVERSGILRRCIRAADPRPFAFHPRAPGRRRFQVGDEKALGVFGVDSGRHAQAHVGGSGGLDRGHRPDHGRRVASSYWAPCHTPVLSRPSMVVFPASSYIEESMVMSAARASGAAPPNAPECSWEVPVSTLTMTEAIPRRATVRVGTPTSRFPTSPMMIASAANSSGWART